MLRTPSLAIRLLFRLRTRIRLPQVKMPTTLPPTALQILLQCVHSPPTGYHEVYLRTRPPVGSTQYDPASALFEHASPSPDANLSDADSDELFKAVVMRFQPLTRAVGVNREKPRYTRALRPPIPPVSP